jgi:hypothetical protein
MLEALAVFSLCSSEFVGVIRHSMPVIRFRDATELRAAIETCTISSAKVQCKHLLLTHCFENSSTARRGAGRE